MPKTRPTVDKKVYDLADFFIQGQIQEQEQTEESNYEVPGNLCSRLVNDKEENTWALADEIQTTIEEFLEGLES